MSETIPTFTIEGEAQVLNNLVKMSETLVDDARFTITKKMVQVKVVDPAHVAMMDLQFGKECFDRIAVSKGNLVGVDLGWLKSCLKMASNRETVFLKSLSVKATKGKSGKEIPAHDNLLFISNGYTDEAPPVNIESMSDPKVPNLNLPTTITINFETLRQVIHSFATAKYDHVILNTDKGCLVITAESDVRKSVCRLDPKKVDMCVKGDEPAKSLFPIDYLHNIFQSMKNQVKDGNITIRMGNDYPIEITAKDEDWSVQFLLAPRIESD